MSCIAAQHTCEELWKFYRQDDSLFKRVLCPLKSRNIVPLQRQVPAETGCAWASSTYVRLARCPVH